MNTVMKNQLTCEIVQTCMKLLWCAVFLLVVGVSAVQASQGQPPRLAIIGAGDFSADVVDAGVDGLPEGLAARISEYLTNSRRFSVLERKAMRKVIGEQRFGQKRRASDIDRLLDEAIDDLDDARGSTVAVTGILAAHNDVLNDFKDLGTVAGADFLVYAKLESLQQKRTTTAVPYTSGSRKASHAEVNARLYLRVIEVDKGLVKGAASLRCKLSEQAFTGSKSELDGLSIFDKLGRQAAAKIIDIVAPARIVSSVPNVLNRGVNDGVKAGDIYTVEREGKEIRGANGVLLGRVKSVSGRIALTQVQETISLFEVIEGAVAVNDLATLVAAPSSEPQVENKPTVALTQDSAVGARQLPRVAVGLMAYGSTASSANVHIPVATDAIISELSKTRRFVVIDRQNVDQLLDEQSAQALMENRQLPSALGTLQGADYLVYGSLQSFCITTQSVQLPGSGRSFSSKVGRIEGSVRIVDVHSGAIMASRQVSLQEKVEPGGSEQRTIAMLAASYAEQVVQRLMSAIYPIKVAAIGNAGAVYISRGADGGLFAGETLTAYRSGAAVVDPDTGAQLGQMETLLGDVVIDRVEEARAVGHSSSMLQIGDILRRASANLNKPSSASSQHKTARNGADLSSGKPEGKATLAVGHIELSKQGNNQLLRGDMLNRVTADLYIKLAKSRRFDLMERQQIDQLLDEQIFTALAQGAGLDKDRMSLQGVDYLILGTVDDFFLQSEQKKIAALDDVQRVERGIVEASLRIVDVNSGKIVASEKVRLNTRLNAAQGRRQQVNDLVDKLTTRMVADVVARLYPIKVLAVMLDGTIFINRGSESGLREGTEFDVMRAGERMIDVDTGIDFGAAEMKIAKVKLTQVEDGRSRVQLVSGREVHKGDILRQSRSYMSHNNADKVKTVRKVNKPSF